MVILVEEVNSPCKCVSCRAPSRWGRVLQASPLHSVHVNMCFSVVRCFELQTVGMFLLRARNPCFFFLRKQSCQLLIHRPNKRFHQKNALFTWNKITHRAGTLLVFKICGWAETKLGRWVVEMRRTRWFGFGEGTETDPADQWDRKRKTKLTVHPEVCSFTNQIVERSPSGLSTPLRRLTRNSCLGKR